MKTNRLERQTYFENCPAIKSIMFLFSKWTIRVLLTLKEHGREPVRFMQLRREVHGISQRVLAEVLRNLENIGLISRKDYPEIPPRVEYELTEKSSTFFPIIENLTNWAAHNSTIFHNCKTLYADNNYDCPFLYVGNEERAKGVMRHLSRNDCTQKNDTQ